MKAIMMSIRPQWIAKILNGEKTIEIRKKFPKGYVGWVYIYCTKDTKYKYGGLAHFGYGGNYCVHLNNDKMVDDFMDFKLGNLNDVSWTIQNDNKERVVARFWCDNVETFRCIITGNLKDGFFKAEPYCKVIEDGIANYNCDDEFEDILKNSQITNEELAQYLGDKREPYGGWYVFNAIHITELEIFNKPKEISEFKQLKNEKIFTDLSWLESGEQLRFGNLVPLTRAPQSWCYVEV